MQLSLCDLSADVVTACQRAFADADDVTIVQGGLADLDVDALITAGNSFGFMCGGVDAALVQAFGWQLQDRVRSAILDDFGGELPIGCAVVVDVNADRAQKLVYAPTMRIPQSVRYQPNAYLAMRAALRAVDAHNAVAFDDEKIHSVGCPGMATGAGEVPPSVAAQQMRQAYDDVVLCRPPPSTLEDARANHVRMLKEP